MIILDPIDVEAARLGSRAALDSLLSSAEKPIYNLAIRMLAHPADAEDATQEILIKIVTHLGSLRDPNAAGGWALKIASRHLVQQQILSKTEAARFSFKGFVRDLELGQAPIEEAQLSDAEQAIALDEVKTGCTLAMLTCLSRNLRIAYILGEVFELSDAEAAQALDLSKPAYRQRLKRARTAVLDFTRANCGLVSSKARCHCSRRVVPAMGQGRINIDRRDRRSGGKEPTDLGELREAIQRLESGRAAAALMRSNREFSSNLKPLVSRFLGPDA